MTPEDKKNTMENTLQEICGNCGLMKSAHEGTGFTHCPKPWGGLFQQAFTMENVRDHMRYLYGSVAAPKEESLQWPSKIELPNHSEKLESENTALREALKELLPIAEKELYNEKQRGNIFLGGTSYEKYKAIIERARKTLNP